MIGACPVGHRLKILRSDVARSKHICRLCSYEARKGRSARKPRVVSPGDVFGDNRVIRYLGVVSGHSRALVCHVPTGRTFETLVSALTTGKLSGWGRANANKVTLLRYGQHHKPETIPKKKCSQYTYQDLADHMQFCGLALLDPPASDRPIENAGVAMISYRCKCGRESEARFTNLFYNITRSCGCDKSKSQASLMAMVQGWMPDVVMNDRTEIAPFELDLWIPSRRVAIEYCGLHWHGEKILVQKNIERGLSSSKAQTRARQQHLDKLRLCRQRGIRLITVFSDEWLTQPKVVEARLCNILGKGSRGPGARELSVRLMRSSSARLFLDQHHIQRACRSKVYLGAYDQDNLVAVMSFSKPNASRSSDGKYDWELVRFATDGKSYAGLASKLMKAFVRHVRPHTIVSYSDNRWSDGGLYRTLGFALLSENPPSYWYFEDHGWSRRFHRYGFRKQIVLKKFGGTPDETEWQIVSRNGYDRIWDCGSKTWLLTL